jgi:integrase
MASLSKDKKRNGYRIQFYATPSKRKRVIWLGTKLFKGCKRPDLEASKVLEHVEHLIGVKEHGGQIGNITASWLKSISRDLRQKLVKADLLEPVADDRGPVTLAPFLAEYVAHRRDVKPATQLCYRRTVTCLTNHFGPDRRLDSITPGDAERWRIWLATEGNQRKSGGGGLADNTVRRRTGRVRQFFGSAIKQGLISSNPFAGLAATVHGNTKRQQFVTRPEIDIALEASTCSDLRAVIALCRYGGLRVPSEVVRLTWQDVDLEAGRLTIHAPKTEHHEDGGVRFCPIFPELRPFLQELHDRANPGIACPMSTPVITRWRSGTQNLRSAFEKLLKRAGVKQWPKLFHNLRASRQTELLGEFPLKDVCSWLGNSEAVAMKHYAMATADSFQQAVCCSTSCSISVNPQASAKNNPNKEPLKNVSSDSSSDPLKPYKLAEAGLEPARSVRNSGF